MGCKGSKVRILSHRPLDSLKAFKERFLKAFFIDKSMGYAIAGDKGSYCRLPQVGGTNGGIGSDFQEILGSVPPFLTISQ